jgi:uncharacterized peroxidase-related enzyme
MNELRIQTVKESEATGKTAELYDRIRTYLRVPMVPDIFQTVSMRPEFLRVVWDGYLAMFDGGVLPRPVKEMIATVVSSHNSCRYCTQTHSLLLRSVGGTAEAAAAAEVAEIDALPVETKYKRLLDLAAKVTQHAYRVTDEDFAGLRKAGLSDEEILEGVFVASLFNAINRLADTFGLYELMQLKEGGTAPWPAAHP